MMAVPDPPSGHTEVPLVAFESGKLSIRQAVSGQDDEAIHALLHRIFIQELGQYPDDGSGRHVDKFEGKNRYFLAECEGELHGMVAVHTQEPFSFAARLPPGKTWQELSDRPVEVRLLSIDPQHRGGRIAAALFLAVHRWARANARDVMFISGVSEQLPLYRRLGFQELGPACPQGDCEFTAMALRLVDAPPRACAAVESVVAAQRSFLPGPPERDPVDLPSAWHRPRYHRSASFIHSFETARQRLSPLLGGGEVALLSGSGTTANDAVAWALRSLFAEQPGWVLEAGEFGGRLVDQARRTGLRFDSVQRPWGETWARADWEAQLAQSSFPKWIWAVQLETSTGVLHPAQELADWCAEHGIFLALDAVSALGAVPIPQEVGLVSGVSGKCLGGLAGVAAVGVSAEVLAQLEPGIAPESLDLAAILRSVGPRHTFPHLELLDLLRQLSDWRNPEEHWQSAAQLGQKVRKGLRELGCTVIAPEELAAPVVTSFLPPPNWHAEAYRMHAEAAGFELAGHSSYLQERGWLQIATMGKINAAQVDDLLAHLRLADPLDRSTLQTPPRDLPGAAAQPK